MPKITIRVANPGKQEAQVLSELSTGSLFIRADKFLPLGTEVQVDLHLPSATEMLPLRGKVSRIVDDDASRARKASGMGLSVDLSHEPVRTKFAQLLTQHHLPVNLPPAAAPSAPEPAPASRPNGRHNGAVAIPLPGSAAPPPPSADARPSLPPADELDLAPPATAAPASSNGSSLPSDWPASWADLVKDTPKPQDARPAPFPFARQEPATAQAVPLPGPVPVAPVTPSVPAPAAPVAAPVPQAEPVAQAAPAVMPLGAPPPQQAAPAAPSVNVQALEARMRDLEKALADARELAMKADTARATSATEHELVVKRLYEEIAAVRAQKIAAPPPVQGATPAAGARKSSALPAIFGLVVGAAAVVAVLLFVPDARTMLGLSPSGSSGVTQPPPVAVTAPPAPAPQTKPEPVAEAKPAPAPELESLAEAAEPEPVAEAAKPEPLAEVTPVAEAKPEPVAETAKPQPVAEVTPVAEAKPAPKAEPVVPAVAQKETGITAVKQTSSVQPVVYGSLNLRADYPATVYVNGKRAGRTPLSGFKTKAGKVYVRFDCVVEDTLMRGKTRTVSLNEDATVTVDHACVE